MHANTHCEALYHDIAEIALQFCLKYNRNSEFRRLCDKLHKHLKDIYKSNDWSFDYQGGYAAVVSAYHAISAEFGYTDEAVAESLQGHLRYSRSDGVVQEDPYT